MNYYLARDGQTYGPYPQENFAAMLTAGQVVAEDLVCPEGGQDWLAANQVPGLLPAAPAAAPVVATAAPATSSAPRLRMSAGSAAPAAATVPPVQAYPQATYPQQKSSLVAKAAGAWGALRVLYYAGGTIIVVVVLLAALVSILGERKQIAKLHSLPGWRAFESANSKIDSTSTTAGYGNKPQAQRAAQLLAIGIESAQKENFTMEKSTPYRGRSRVGRAVSALDSAAAGKGHFQSFVELRDDRIIALIHVPEFHRYKQSAREAITELCWDISQELISATFKEEESQAASRSSALPSVTSGTVSPSGRSSPGRPPPALAKLTSPKAIPKPPKEITLVVGVRSTSGYASVYVGRVGASEDLPTPINHNVPSHKELVKWFADEKPDPAKE